METDQHRGPRVRQLERALQEREERIADLEARLEAVRDASSATGRRAGPSTGAEPGDGRDGRRRTDGWPGEFDPAASDTRFDALDDVPDDRDPAAPAEVSHAGRPDGPDDGRYTRRPTSSDGVSTGADGVSTRSDGVSTERRPVVAHLRSTIEQLGPVTRKMLAHYHEYGPASPLDANVVAGGDGDRTAAYRRNGDLREAGLVAHVGRGRYATRLRQIVVEAHGGRLEAEEVQRAVCAVEELLPVASPPEMAADWPEP